MVLSSLSWDVVWRGCQQSGDHFRSVTELAGDRVTPEQITRMIDRYQWAAGIGAGRDVLEIACGTGQGLGLLADAAVRVAAGDISPAMVEQVRAHYDDRVDARVMDATALPFEAASFDVVVLFEAIYYLPDLPAFLAEARRVLRPGGDLLIATANPDLSDFNPSPYSQRYYGVRELAGVVSDAGFSPSLFGNTPIGQLSMRQRLLRPVKRAAVKLGVMPKSMRGKERLKRLVFGDLVPMPPELAPTSDPPALAPIAPQTPDREHKVLLCRATLPDKRGLASRLITPTYKDGIRL